MVLCIGEILADLIGECKDGIVKYERFVGGAPLNVACGINNLGGSVGFVGSVGDDIIGRYLHDYCTNLGFDYLDIYLDLKHNTTLAFVENDPNGERSFCFFRQNTADYQISEKRLDCIAKANIVHVGSLMLREEVGRQLARFIMDYAKKNNVKISFDINFRDDIYNSTEEAKEIYLEFIKKADILKFSEDEVSLFSGKIELESINDIVRPDQIVFVTLGSKGSYCQFNGKNINVESIKIKPVDTTGAGDAFYACVLKFLDEINLSELTLDYVKEVLRKANCCGALACSKKGALSALPTVEELNKLLNN